MECWAIKIIQIVLLIYWPEVRECMAIALQMFYKSFSAEQSPENPWKKETTTILKGLRIGIRPTSG